MNVLCNRAAILLFLINKYKLVAVKGGMQDFVNEAVAASYSDNAGAIWSCLLHIVPLAARSSTTGLTRTTPSLVKLFATGVTRRDDVYVIEPGHDGEVIGNENFVGM